MINPSLSFHFLTLFPEIGRSLSSFSLFEKATQAGLVSCSFYSLRDFTLDRHRTVDGSPYGGGEGMLLRADVLYRAWKGIRSSIDLSTRRCCTVLLSPQGELWTQSLAKKSASSWDEFIFVCGHYEGVDERFIQKCVDFEISIGNYILTGGELPALILADTLARLVPGVIGNEQSVIQDSLSSEEDLLLKHPQYTRPFDFEGMKVPEILLSGHHEKIATWRREQRLLQTQKKRPDLL